MTIAQQRRVDHWGTPRLIGRRRMRRAHDPAGLGGRHDRHRGNAQHQSGDAGLACGERQLAARDEIERPGLTPDFRDDAAERIAGQPIGRNAQRALGIRRAHDHDAARVQSQFGEARHRQIAILARRKILPHPQQKLCVRQPPRETGNEPCRGRGMPILGEHLVQSAAQQPAAQRHIGLGMAEQRAARRIDHLRRIEMRDVAAQTRERIEACAHARRSCSGWQAMPVSDNRLRPKCSCYVLLKSRRRNRVKRQDF